MPQGKYIAKGTLGRNQYSADTKRKPIYPIGPSIAYIPLTKGKFACVDWDDAEYLSQWNWVAWWAKHGDTWYAIRHWNVEGQHMSMGMHRHIIRDVDSVDHKTPGNGLDNRRSNLREATRQQQARNRRVRSDSGSGMRGVQGAEGRWRAKISVGSKRIHLGYFSTAELACAAYREAATKYHGDFAQVA